MKAYEARESGRLIYVDASGAVVRRTKDKASLHVANYVGAVELDALTREDRTFVGTRVAMSARGGGIHHYRLVDEHLAFVGDLRFSDFRPFAEGVAPARMWSE